ncbi:MAG: nucleotidyltransferase family protein [Thermoproteota archaeon]
MTDIVEGVILAAGKGTRMRPYSNAVNKEMSLIGSSPVIEYNVRALASCGIKKVYVVLSDRKEQIMEFLRSGKDFGVNVAYLYQDMEKGKGTAKALEVAEPWVGSSFILVYGDSFFHPTNFFLDMIKFHQEESADVTMGIYLMSDYKDYGIVKLQNNKVEDILEKVSETKLQRVKVDGMYPVNSGPILFSKSVFNYIRKTQISPAGEYWLTDSIRLMIEDGKKVLGFIIPKDVFWRDIGRMEQRMEAEWYYFQHASKMKRS